MAHTPFCFDSLSSLVQLAANLIANLKQKIPESSLILAFYIFVNFHQMSIYSFSLFPSVLWKKLIQTVLLDCVLPCVKTTRSPLLVFIIYCTQRETEPQEVTFIGCVILGVEKNKHIMRWAWENAKTFKGSFLETIFMLNL